VISRSGVARQHMPRASHASRHRRIASRGALNENGGGRASPANDAHDAKSHDDNYVSYGGERGRVEQNRKGGNDGGRAA